MRGLITVVADITQYPDDPLRTRPGTRPDERWAEFAAAGVVTREIDDGQQMVIVTDDDWLAAAPDLAPVRTAAEGAELADAAACLTDSCGFRLRADHPRARLARDVAEALALAGFTLHHHCAQTGPLYRLGGVCLLPVTAAAFAEDHDGVTVSWPAHSLLMLDWDRWGENRGCRTR